MRLPSAFECTLSQPDHSPLPRTDSSPVGNPSDKLRRSPHEARVALGPPPRALRRGRRRRARVAQARVAARYPVTTADLAAGRAGPGRARGPRRGPSTGYARERFGQAWADVDRNGCDTRNDVLRRDLVGESDRHRRLRGAQRHADDPYTGVPIPFARGPDSRRPCRSTTSSRWPTPGRRARSRGRPDSARRSPTTRPTCWPSTGPPTRRRAPATRPRGCRRNRGYRCVYALRQVRVKAAYGLWVTDAEHDALAASWAAASSRTVRRP